MGMLDWFKKNQEAPNFKTPEEYYAWKEKWLENKPSEDTTNEPQNKQLDNPNAKIADEIQNTSATTPVQKLPADTNGITFDFELPQHERIMAESLNIINQTKNIDTAISRFQVIKTSLSRLFEIKTPGRNLSVEIRGKIINTTDTISVIDNVKTEFVRNHFVDKIANETKKADGVSDLKTKKKQYKKALNIALKSLAYIENDEVILGHIQSIENLIAGLPEPKVIGITKSKNEQLDNPNTKIADEIQNPSTTTPIQKLPADIRIDFSFELEKFPDRTYAVKLRNQNILKALALGNIGLANLSFAKMVESIRHRNSCLDGSLDTELALIREIYDSFRLEYHLEYPNQFLPPKERPTKWVNTEGAEAYFCFQGVVRPKTPKQFIPLLDTIKKKWEWDSLGFKLKSDAFDDYKPFLKNGLCFGFDKVHFLGEIEEKAISTGKKITTHPINILEFLRYGCTYEDFVSINEDVIAYCEAYMNYQKGQFEVALKEINKAIEINPCNRLYHELYFDLKFALKDVSVIEEAIAYYIETYGGISAMAYHKTTDRWIKLLCSLGEHQKALDIINIINQLFDEEIAEKTVFKYKKPSGYTVTCGGELIGEQLAMRSHNNELELVKSLKEKFNSRIVKLKERAIKKRKPVTLTACP